MKLDGLPELINRDALTSACESLGIPITDQRLRSLLIEPQKITLTYVRADPNGYALRAGDEIATVTVTVHIADAD